MLSEAVQALKDQVYAANMALPKYGLVTFTWGNVSGINRDEGLIAIKPSGVAYEVLTPHIMVIVDLNGKVVSGNYKPSSDLQTHLALYRAFPEIGGIVHTHSTYATAYAQAGMPIPALGTTHADYFRGEVPCTRALTKEEIDGDYETETGNIIIEYFKQNNLSCADIPAALVNGHGPFAWGKNASDAMHNAVVLEKVAWLSIITLGLDPTLPPMSKHLLEKHFLRKHGDSAYYGQ